MSLNVQTGRMRFNKTGKESFGEITADGRKWVKQHAGNNAAVGTKRTHQNESDNSESHQYFYDLVTA